MKSKETEKRNRQILEKIDLEIKLWSRTVIIFIMSMIVSRLDDHWSIFTKIQSFIAYVNFYWCNPYIYPHIHIRIATTTVYIFFVSSYLISWFFFFEIIFRFSSHSNKLNFLCAQVSYYMWTPSTGRGPMSLFMRIQMECHSLITNWMKCVQILSKSL